MLRAATFPLFGLSAKFWGLVIMGGAIIIPMALPDFISSQIHTLQRVDLAHDADIVCHQLLYPGLLGTRNHRRQARSQRRSVQQFTSPALF